MANVGFYLIQSQIRQPDLACRICRKSIQAGQQPLLVKFDDPDTMQQLDALLWQFDPASFIVHDIDDWHAPICLSLSIPPQFKGDCLNLSQSIIDPGQFGRVLEIVENTDVARVRGRERFKAYRALGIEPVTYQV